MVIATGIFEPEAGGPATFAARMAALLTEAGWEVTVVTYADEERYDFDDSYAFRLVRVVRSGLSTLPGAGKVSQLRRYYKALKREAADADLIYTLDWMAAGLPASLAARTLRKPYIARVGGDYAWEQKYCEEVSEPLPLREFYESGAYLRGKYRLYHMIVRHVLRGAAHVVFNSQAQRDLYRRYFRLSAEGTSVITNAVPRKEFSDIRRTVPTREIVYWGRFNGMKNIATLVRAFAMAGLPDSYSLVLIGDGPAKAGVEKLVEELHLGDRVELLPGMRQKDALERVKNARAFVLPSWTDISPNQVYEALAIGLPLVVTQENFLPIRDKLPLMVDPSSVDDVAGALQTIADDAKYDHLVRGLVAISYERSWQDVLREHLALFRERAGIDGVRVLQIGADRSKRGILYPGSAAAMRQAGYGACFDSLDIIGFSLVRDGRAPVQLADNTRVYPTNSLARIFYGFDALRIARRIHADVVSAQDPFETGFVAWLISRIKGVPLHVQVHADFLSPRYWMLGLGNKIRVLVARFILRRATRIRVVSERIKRSIEKELHPDAPITVLPIYTDVQHFARTPADRALVRRFAHFAKKVLVVSRLEPEKHVALALHAFVRAASRDACLIIVGSGSQRAALDRAVRDLKVHDRVFFETPGDIAPYFKLADVVLVPSHFEGYGLVIIEALAAGKPVISTDVGIAREAGAIIAQPERFAEALREWFASGHRTARLKEYPYESFDQYVQAYCDDIRSCIAREKRHNSHTHDR